MNSFYCKGSSISLSTASMKFEEIDCIYSICIKSQNRISNQKISKISITSSSCLKRDLNHKSMIVSSVSFLNSRFRVLFESKCNEILNFLSELNQVIAKLLLKKVSSHSTSNLDIIIPKK
jgi:hypothetical protein